MDLAPYFKAEFSKVKDTRLGVDHVHLFTGHNNSQELCVDMETWKLD